MKRDPKHEFLKVLLGTFFLCILLCSCSENTGKKGKALVAANRSSEEQPAVINYDEVVCDNSVISSKPWHGVVQIGNIVVASNSIPLSYFEEEGYELRRAQNMAGELATFDDTAITQEVTLIKDDITIGAYITIPTEAISYRDATISYISRISIEDGCKIPVWVVGGIKLGSAVASVSNDEIAAKTLDSFSKDSFSNAYVYYPIKDLYGNQMTFNRMNYIKGDAHLWGKDESMPIWGPPSMTLYVNEEDIITGYSFLYGDYVAEIEDGLEYQTETYVLENGQTIVCPTLKGPFIIYRDKAGAAFNPSYGGTTTHITNSGFYERGDSFAYITITLLQDNDFHDFYNHNLRDTTQDIAYRGENYTVYLTCYNRNGDKDKSGIDYIYCLVRDDDPNHESAIDIEMTIWDNNGTMIPEYNRDSYKVTELYTENVNLQTPYFEGSYAYELAVDIFDHIAQYSVQ